jgi:hypothetical protein
MNESHHSKQPAARDRPDDTARKVQEHSPAAAPDRVCGEQIGQDSHDHSPEEQDIFGPGSAWLAAKL